MVASTQAHLRPLRIPLLIFILILSLPISLFNWVFFSVFQVIVLVLARIFRPDLSSPLSPIQSSMAVERINSKPKMNMLIYNIIDGVLSCEHFRARFTEKVLHCTNGNCNLVYPELKQFKTSFLWKYFWKDDKNFDIKNHVRLYDYRAGSLALPSPCTEADLERCTGELLAHPWKKGRSPWEVLLITDYAEDGLMKTVLVFRLHHCLADGYSMLKLICRLADSPESTKLPQPFFPRPTPIQRFFLTLTFPFKFYYYYAKMTIDGWDGENPWHLTNKKLSRTYNTCLVKRIPIASIKEVKRKYNVGYNAVLASIVCGGVRRLMIDSGNKLPETLATFNPLPLPNHPDGLTIHAAGVFVRWPMRQESEEERLRSIHRSMMANAMWDYLWACRVLIALVSPFPSFLAKPIQRSLVKCTALFSSFPSLSEYPQIFGYKTSDIMFAFGLPPGKPGASITLLSLGENQRILVTVDKTVLNSREKLGKISEYIQEELELLLKKDKNIV